MQLTRDRLGFFAITIFAVILLIITKDPGVGHADLPSFWIAGHVYLDGSNPYEIHNISKYSYDLGLNGLGIQEVVHFPWDMLLFALLAQIPYEILNYLVYILNILGVAVIFFWVKTFGKKLNISILCNPPVWATGMVMALTIFFKPLYHTILAGQFSLIFIVIFLLSLDLYLSKHRFACGFILSLSIIKLHLFLIIYAVIATRLLLNKEWRVIAGGISGCLLLPCLTYFLNPMIFNWYFQREIPLEFFDATLGAWIQALDPRSTWLRFIPLVVVALSAVFMVLKRISFKSDLVLFNAAFLASMLVTPHVYPYDFVILLPWAWILVYWIAELNAKTSLTSNVFSLFLVTSIFLSHVITLLLPPGMNYMAFYPIALSLITWILQSRHHLLFDENTDKIPLN